MGWRSSHTRLHGISRCILIFILSSVYPGYMSITPFIFIHFPLHITGYTFLLNSHIQVYHYTVTNLPHHNLKEKKVQGLSVTMRWLTQWISMSKRVTMPFSKYPSKSRLSKKNPNMSVCVFVVCITLKCMLGWQIVVTNLMVGGWIG